MRQGAQRTEASASDMQGAIAAAANAPSPGLCAICDKSADCVYVTSFGPPLVSCDEATPPAPHAPYAPAARPLAAQPEPRLGLCATCERRGDCTFPRPEGGVWQCEEFV